MQGTTEADEAKLGFSFEGVIPNLHRRYQNSESEFVRDRLQQYMSGTPCPLCNGKRLQHRGAACDAEGEGSWFDIQHRRRHRFHHREAQQFFASLDLNSERRKIAEPILRETAPPALGFWYRSASTTSRSIARQPRSQAARPGHPARHAGWLGPCRRVLRAR